MTLYVLYTRQVIKGTAVGVKCKDRPILVLIVLSWLYADDRDIVIYLWNLTK